MDDLIELLKLIKPLKVRQGAANILLGLTREVTSLLSILSNKKVVSSVWDCLADQDKELSVTAAQILVNVTSHSDKYPSHQESLPELLTLLHKPDAIYLYNSIAMILNNISRAKSQVEGFNKMVYLADCQNFVRLVSQGKEQGYLAAVLGNLAVTERGREQVLDESVFPEFISFLTMPGNVIVRRSAARLFRNLSFDVKNHIKLSEYLPQLVFPLVGGEEIEEEEMEKLPLELQYLPEDKMRESDLKTRIYISDTLFQMGGSYFVREQLRDGNYYILLKNYDQWEGVDEARERVQNVIYLMIQDDGEVDLRKEGELPVEVEEVEKEEMVDLRGASIEVEVEETNKNELKDQRNESQELWLSG